MSNAGISFGGLASGLDTKALILALVAVERRPIAAMELRKTTLQKSKDLFGNLGDLLVKLRDKANALRSTTDFLAMKASVDQEQYLTATASSSATPGSHQVRVLALAQAQVNSSNGRADRDSFSYGASTLQLTINGVDHWIDVPESPGGATTLDGIAGAINARGLDVVADVVNTGAATDPYQLVLRSRTTGSAGSFTLALDSGSTAMQTLVNEVNANVRTPGSDAQVAVNGITFTRSSNTIGDVIPGVTLNLRSLTPGTDTATLTVTTDAEATAKKLQDFVDAYNAVVDFVQNQNQLDANGKAKNPLFGDSTLRSIRSTLRSTLGNSVDTGNPAYSLLSQVGITTDTAGKLSFNRAKFDEALADDENAVASLFNHASDGLARKIYDQAQSYTDTVDGLLQARKDGFESLLRQTQTRIDASERRLQQFQVALERRFANLETLMSRLQSQGNALGSLR